MKLAGIFAHRIKEAKTASPREAYEHALAQRTRQSGEFTRDPVIEATILKNWAFAASYASNVLEGRWPEFEREVENSPTVTDPNQKIAVVYYARDVLNDFDGPYGEKIRWTAAEHHVSDHPDVAFRYARDVIGGRWEPGSAGDLAAESHPEKFAVAQYRDLETTRGYTA